jgi:hypothetical protein
MAIRDAHVEESDWSFVWQGKSNISAELALLPNVQLPEQAHVSEFGSNPCSRGRHLPIHGSTNHTSCMMNKSFFIRAILDR